MSLFERKAGWTSKGRRGIALAGVLATLAVASACTVRPLYNSGPAVAGAQTGSAAVLSTIAIKPAISRFEQEVRNHLIFHFSGGAGEPDNPAYLLQLNVTSTPQSAAVVQVAKEDEPTAGTVTLRAVYVLRQAGTGKSVTSGQRQIISSFDTPRQQFAAARAERNAQNRAARELAQLIGLAIAQALEAKPRG